MSNAEHLDPEKYRQLIELYKQGQQVKRIMDIKGIKDIPIIKKGDIKK